MSTVVLSDSNIVNGIKAGIPDNTVIVKNASQLTSPLNPTINYFIDGFIDMGTTQIKVPEGGLNISGYNFDNSCLFSTADNYTMFVKEDLASYAGYLRINNIALDPSGLNSKIFDLDNQENFNAVELINCNIGDFTGDLVSSIGELSNYRLTRFDGCGFVRCLDGLTFSGTIAGGLVVTNSIGLSLPAMTLFKEGTNLVINGDCRSNANMNSVDSDFVFCDFRPENITTDGGYRLTEFRTTATNALPNLPNDSIKSIYRFCEGIDNTYIGGIFSVTTGATTTISTVDTPVKMAGVTTATNLSNFDTGGVDNRLKYISDLPREFIVNVIGEFTGGNNDVMELQIRKYNSLDVLQQIVDIKTATLNGGVAGIRAENIVAEGFVTFNKNDYIELWVANKTDITDITTVVETQLKITER